MTAPIDWPTVPQSGPKADAVRQILKEDQTAGRIPHRALRPGSRRAPHGGRPAGRRDLRRHAQEQDLGGDRSFAHAAAEAAASRSRNSPRRWRRGCRTAPASRRTASSMSSSRTAFCNIPAAEFFYEGPDVAVSDVVPEGQLIPKAEESFNHTARECRVGPDNKLYIQLGQPFNVPTKEKADLYRKIGMGGIIRMDQDGKNREIYATGLRNPVGIDFNPKDKSLWSNDNQVDGMGDDIPPGEMNRIDKMGEEFGFPWYGGGHIRTNEFKNDTPPADVGLPGSRAGRACGRPRPLVLHRRHVPGEVQERDLLDPARLVEPHRAGRRAHHGHLPQGRWPCRRAFDPVRGRLERQRPLSRPPGRRRSNIGTDRCSCPTISSAPSIASGTTASKN